ncbi:MAG: hypothetical protein TREMPRED_002351 [Tremellales sp. Tagirdzhanova-0007]|nr:MAG: hypothetical protein TREMPRED_002351 [Tremellales sp. Tagirdzhanova-0007]
MAVVEDVSDDETISQQNDEISSGLRHRPSIPKPPLIPQVPPTDLDHQTPVASDQTTDEWFDTLIVAIPFCFLYLLLDILVHLQYQHRPTIQLLARHLVSAVPTLVTIVFYSNRYPTHVLVQLFLVVASVFSGTRLIWLFNKASWSVVTGQASAVGTLWILTIVQLPLGRAVIALAAVAGWCWWIGIKVIP